MTQADSSTYLVIGYIEIECDPQALQSSTTQRLGAFGTLIGDKAAEMTSIASSMGDFLQPSAATSLLSSFRSRFQ